MKILVVDDETPILELIKYNLQKEGFSVITAENGSKALEYARLDKPDLILLDLMLPDMTGFDICRILHNDKRTSNIPIIMATARTDDEDIVSGLELGADDYITKPFSPKVLMARVRSVLRRSHEKAEEIKDNNNSKDEVIRIHGFRIIPNKFEVTYNEKEVSFSATEFYIFRYLAENPGRVFSRQQLINDIKGASYPATERSIDVQILNIRKKLVEVSEDDSVQNLIETVRGVGYRFIEE